MNGKQFLVVLFTLIIVVAALQSPPEVLAARLTGELYVETLWAETVIHVVLATLAGVGWFMALRDPAPSQQIPA